MLFNLKTYLLAAVFVSGGALAYGYYLSEIFVCGPSVECYFLQIKTAPAILYGSLGLFLVFILLLLIPTSFSAWKRFAIWYIPLAAVLFVIWHDPRGFDITPPPVVAYKFISAIYVIVSTIIIFRHWWKTRRQ